MNKTKQLRNSVRDVLHDCSGLPIHHRLALPTSRPPFGVFLLDLVTRDGSVDVYDLTLDVCDYLLQGQDGNLDDICDRIEAQMDYRCYLDDVQTWETYLTSRRIIEENDKNIQRRRLTFVLRFINLEVQR